MTIETAIDNAIHDFGVSGDAMRWTATAGEVAYLRERLAAAEQVATMYGWTSGGTEGKTEKAVEQAYCDWVNTYGSPRPSPEWRTRIAVLARRRDAIRSAMVRVSRSIGKAS
jgi:hypothetical protein